MKKLQEAIRNIEEAEEISVNELSPDRIAFAKKLGFAPNDIVGVWDGIHGIIMKMKSKFRLGYFQFSRDYMKTMLKYKNFRWVETDTQNNTITVGV